VNVATRRATATTNLRFTLGGPEFEAGLRKVLARDPDLLFIQEAGHDRDHILDRVAADLGYLWARPLSPNGDPVEPIMWRPDRLRLRHLGTVLLARGEFVGHLPGRKDRLPASYATEAIFDDLVHPGKRVAALGYHLTAEVESPGGGYRLDPRHLLRVLRHQRERRRLGRRARAHKRHGHVVRLGGDGNYDRMTIRGFVSCWVGHGGGSLGWRAVDAIHAEQGTDDMVTITTPSDHDAVVAYY